MGRKRRNERIGKRKGSAGQPSSIKKLILDAFQEHPKRIFNYKQVARRISLNTSRGKEQVQNALFKLVEEGALLENDPGQFQLHEISKIVIGVIDITQKGSGFVIVEGIENDIFIPSSETNRALNGDTVEVKVVPEKKGKLKGRVTNVLERKKIQFVGSLEVSEKFAFFTASSSKMNQDIFIPKNKLNNAKHRQKVVVKMTEWPVGANSPFGEVVEILGNPGENDAEMNSILADYGFPLNFPERVEEAASKIDTTITDEEIAKREDFRKVATFTIDPHDAKDFDDALSIRVLENDKLEIGVHIADVTHYVQPKSIIEKEAVSRATSVYLVDRVIPMLPEVLSNGVCSLRPNEDKLCYSCIFTFDKNHKIVNHRITRSVIHSDRRFAYEDVQEILEGKSGDFEKELHILNTIAKEKRALRLKEGSIAFDKVEVRFNLDEEKKPVGVLLKVQKDAHKLIEEFMLLANKTVASDIGNPKGKFQKPRTFVYRIHDTPDPEKLKTFSHFIKRFGYDYAFGEGNVAQNLNALLQEVQGKGEENTIENLAIRTMAKAVYTSENIGHYGLGFSHYSHFTSPIRRYPDMMVHRLLTQYLAGQNEVDKEWLEGLCKHSSEMEQLATNAERESTKYFQVLFMQGTEGQEFTGIVSGMSEWGMYIELEESKCEGMIRLRDISGDYFTYDEDNYQVIGNNTKTTINLGQKLIIKVKEADLVRKRLDFELVDFAEVED